MLAKALPTKTAIERRTLSPVTSPRIQRVAASNHCACGGGCPRCQKKSALPVSKPDDVSEREADHVAQRVMSLASPTTNGAMDVGNTAPMLLRSAATTSAAPSPVRDELNSPGTPLDVSTRRFFEPRFGRDFNSVRVHTDARAAQSASAVDALAYTVGNDVVFGAGRYAPLTHAGRQLLAHELTHVIQQSTSSRTMLQRVVDAAHVHCNPGQNGAWDDPVAALTSMDEIARLFAMRVSNMLFLASIALPGDPGGTRADVLWAYHRRFGPPQAVAGGFRNRFSGDVLPTIEEAQTAELEVLSARFQRVADFFLNTISYFCRANGTPFTMPPCGSATCRPGEAFAYDCTNGPRRISLCPDFWREDRGLEDGALTMIHEAVHMIFDFQRHPSTTAAQRGRNPSCYDNFIADLLGYPTSSGRCEPVGGP